MAIEELEDGVEMALAHVHELVEEVDAPDAALSEGSEQPVEVRGGVAALVFGGDLLAVSARSWV
jgi:hypothetical protein